MNSVVRSSSLLEAIDTWAEKTPDKTAMTFLNDSGEVVDPALTYSTLRQRIDGLAAHLQGKLGLGKGSTCLLVYPPSLDFTVAFLACLRAGVIAVPCFPPDPRRLKKDLHMFTAIQGSSGATIALTSNMYNYAKKMSDIKSMFSGGASWPELQWVVTDSLSESATGEFPAPDPADVAFLQYTSGSTSEPKGVMITHANLSDNLTLIVDALGAIDDTVVVSWLPQYHDMGLVGSVLALLFCGGSGYYMSPTSFIKRPALWVELMSRYRATHMQAPNFAFGLTARKFLSLDEQPQLDLSCVRHMINAAEPVDAASIDRFYAVFEAHGLKRGVIFPTYGLAEHTVYVCSNGRRRLNVDRILLETERRIRLVENKLEMWSYGVEGAGTIGGKNDGVLTSHMIGCGRPGDNKGVDLRIVDTESTRALPEGRVGEIWIRSKSRAAGYWSKPDKTKEDFGGCLAGESEGSDAAGVEGGDGSPVGFLRTGDLGFLLDGELYICGRIKDLVIVRGRNHYPQDIERTAEAAVPGSLRGGCSAAFGADVPGGGEVLGLVAEVAAATGTNFEALAAEIRRCVAAEHGASLACVRLMRPRTVPKTTSGKIARAMCKRAHTSGTLDRDTVFLWGEASTTATARDAAAELAEIQPSAVVPSAGVEETKRSAEDNMDPRNMSESEILHGIQYQVARILKADANSIPTDAPLGALGLDSMEAMQLMALLEEKFLVKLPDDLMLDEDTTLALLAPVIKAGGIVPERATVVDCGMLAAEEATDGPPKGYMADQAVEAKRIKTVAKCSHRARVDNGQFKAGSLSERVKMTFMDSLVARAFLLTVGGSEFAVPVVIVACLALLSPLVTAAVLGALIIVSFAVGAGLRRFPPAGRHSSLKARVMKHLSFKMVTEGRQDPGKAYVYVGVGLGAVEQILLSSVAPSTVGNVVHQTSVPAWPFPLSPLLRGIQCLLGAAETCDVHEEESPLSNGQSVCLQAKSSKAIGFAPAVAAAIRHGAQIVPCVVFGDGVGGEEGAGRFEMATAAVGAALEFGRSGVLMACAKPLRVPFTKEPTQSLVMEFAEATRAAAEQAREDYTQPFFGFQ